MPTRKKPQFEAIAQKWANDALVIKPSDLPECVYHYTDAAGLIGMLNSGKIWATDYRFLNDRSEIVHTRMMLRDLINSKMRSSPDAIRSKFYAGILESDEKEQELDLFVFSMSEAADDLSQWRGYAREGEGFTIGFCASTVYQTSEPATAPFGFARVEYDHGRQRSALERALQEMETELVRVVSTKPRSVDDVVLDAAYWFIWMTQSRAASNKHRSFRGEREWRILAFADPKDVGSRVRASGVRLVRYAELVPQGKGKTKLPIKEIGIGPGFVGSEDIHAVKELCRESGYSVKIYSADTPYRRS